MVFSTEKIIHSFAKMPLGRKLYMSSCVLGFTLGSVKLINYGFPFCGLFLITFFPPVTFFVAMFPYYNFVFHISKTYINPEKN